MMTTLLGVTTLETSFTSGPSIFSYLDAGYSYSLVSVSALVNASNMLICSGSFSGFPQLCLTGARGAKDTCIEGVCIENTCIAGPCT